MQASLENATAGKFRDYVIFTVDRIYFEFSKKYTLFPSILPVLFCIAGQKTE